MTYLGAQSGMKILEVGCGTGFLARLLCQMLDDIRVTGLEADKKLLALARRLVEREALTAQVELQCGNAYQLPYPDESFDLVTSQTFL